MVANNVAFSEFKQTLAPNRNVALFHILMLIHYCSFINGNWIFYWTHFMTFGQLGVVDASAFAFGLFMEVPTGAVADMIGKKRTMLAAMLITGGGIMLMATGNDMMQLWIGFLIAQVGWAFSSGATEALAFDSLKERGQEAMFERVLTLNQRMGIITIVITSLIGGVMYNLDFRLPHFAWSAVYLIGFGFALFLVEPKVVDSVKFSLRGYFNQLGEGFRQLAQPALRPFIPLMFALLGVYFLYSAGLIQPVMATQFGFLADGQAIVYALLGICAAVVVGFLPALRKRFGDTTGLALLALIMALGFFGGALPLGVWGFGALLLIRLTGSLANPWISVIVNRAIPSQSRATTLSTVSLIVKIPYVVSAVIAGELAEAGTFNIFSIALAIFILIMLTLSLFIYSRQPLPTSE